MVNGDDLVRSSTPPPDGANSDHRNVELDALKVYQVWKGNNKFCCDGRLVFGPDGKALILSSSLIVAPVILFCAFVSGGLRDVYSHHIGDYIVIIAAVWTIYVLSLLFLTASRDPGIIPRSLHPPEPEDDGYLSTLSSDWLAGQNGPPAIPPTKDVVVNGLIFKVKYCHTCMLYRPPQCSHCSICDNCVERFDHHCPWVGQCIGRRNYRLFFMFVVSTAMLCFYVLAFSCINITKIMNDHHWNLWSAFLKSPVSGILILYTSGAGWFVGGLSTLHLYLICTNQTTYENFRYQYTRKMNPHNRGCFRNIAEVFCSRTPPSKHNFREHVKFDPSFIDSEITLPHTMRPEMPTIRHDIEMGNGPAVDAEHLEDIRSQVDTAELDRLERCGTQLRHSNGDNETDRPATPDMQNLETEFGMEDGSNTDRQKIVETYDQKVD